MARVGYTIEGHLDIVGTDGDIGSGAKVLFGTGAPLGTSGPTDDAAIGSMYMDKTAGHTYKKTASTSSASDWILEGKLSAAYSLPANALPAASDVFEDAIGKMDANQQDLTTLSGVAIGSVDNGTFPGNIIADNATTYEALEDLEAAIEQIAEDNSADGVTTVTTIDSELVDSFNRCEWIVSTYFVDDRARSESYRISASHNGHSGADATTIDVSVDAKHRHGAAYNSDVDVVLVGAAGSQTMELQITSSETNGVDVRTRKIGCTIAQG